MLKPLLKRLKIMKSTKLKMKSVLFVSAMCLMAFLETKTYAQEDLNTNLTVNGSFEELDNSRKKPKKLGSIDKLKDWESPTGVKADAFRSDVKDVPEVGIPKNKYGQEDPQHGDHYAGILAFQTGKKSKERSYLSVPLTTPLKKNKEYCVEFYVSLGEASKYAINSIGAIFRKKLDPIADKVPIIEDKIHIQHPENIIFNAFNGWEKICGTYKARGGEQYILIGNFTASGNLKRESARKPKNIKASVKTISYYYIDNVTVREYFPTEDSYRSAMKISKEDWADMTNNDKNYQPCQCKSGGVEEDHYSDLINDHFPIIEDEMNLGEKIAAHQVYFGFGKDELTDNGEENLVEIVKLLEENPSASITVIGHTDAEEDKVGLDKPMYSKMDQKRAKKVYDELVAYDIDRSRLTIELKNSTSPHPLAEGIEGEEELDQARNRRVEFKLK